MFGRRRYGVRDMIAAVDGRIAKYNADCLLMLLLCIMIESMPVMFAAVIIISIISVVVMMHACVYTVLYMYAYVIILLL